MLDNLPAHSPDCRPLEGFCASDCERYDAIMADAQWGRPQPIVQHFTWEAPDDRFWYGCLLAVGASAFAWCVVIGLLLWWLL